MQAHWNNNPQVDMSLHPIILSWLRANQSLRLLLNTACMPSEETANTNFIAIGFTWPGLEPEAITCTLTITLPMRYTMVRCTKCKYQINYHNNHGRLKIYNIQYVPGNFVTSRYMTSDLRKSKNYLWQNIKSPYIKTKSITRKRK